MNRPEFDSEFCNVQYIKEERIVLLTWKKFCFFDQYREPLFFALSLLKSFPKSSFAVDTRNGFEVVREDVEWNFHFLLPALLNTSLKQIILISEAGELPDGARNLWSEEFLKYFIVKRVGSYPEALRNNRYGIKRRGSKMAGGALLYELFMFVAAIIYTLILTFSTLLTSEAVTDSTLTTDLITDKLTSSGIPYLMAIIPGIPLLFWYFHNLRLTPRIFQGHRRMTVKSFFMIFFIFMSAQGVFTLVSGGLEFLFNLFGLSIMSAIEAASVDSTTVSMFLYASFLAPITEEIVFRGFILRGLEKYGRTFAIVISAILFGAMHGNLIQGVFAAATGLVFGYVALEYSIKWSILLHIINNFVFGDLFVRLTSGFGELTQQIIWGCLELIFFIVGLIVVILKRREIIGYLKQEKTTKGLYKASFTSAWMIVFLVLQFLLSLSGITRLQ